MALSTRRVRVTCLDTGEERFGILVETEDGRALVALPAETEAELASAIDLAGGPLALARSRGARPLDPEGLAPAPGGGTGYLD